MIRKIVLAFLLCPLVSLADTTITFEAAARSEIPNDEMVVNLAVERRGADTGALNEAVINGMRSIIAEAKAVAGVNAKLGYLATNPNYVNNVQDGWVVQGGIVLDSKDMKALGELAGKLVQDAQISGISFRLSNEAKEKEESVLLSQAARNFRRKATEAAQAFGFKNYVIKQVTINRPNERSYAPGPASGMARPVTASVIPAARGNSEVIVTISGVTVMK
jgi:predicted secreted protein